ncbi:helix-turn-helix domain-containing protein [Paenibacillus flagellatus]|uniref:helix-turn-helix domain-containing protein n=1 Tax=Paenibacillus flagellatus TaxID=2211139 RepID=UPI0013052A67|nr:helix-turn-helix domain-containing protein [Paenibacillus flagellatus]
MTWLISYVVVLLFPVCLSGLVYMLSSRMLERETHQANEALMNQFREAMDNQFETMKRLNFELTWNVKVRQLLYSNKYLYYPNDFYYDLHQITQDLNLYKTSFSQIDLFYIHLAGDRLVMLPNVYRSDAFGYELLHRSEALSFERWQSLVDGRRSPGYIPAIRVTEEGTMKPTVAYISAYSSDSGEPVGANVVMIDQSRILGAVQQLELYSKGHVAILNERNEVLVSSSDEALPAGLVDRLNGQEGPFLWSDGERGYEISYVTSGSSKLKYVSIVPSRIFWEKVRLVRRVTDLSIAISVLGGLALTAFFLRKNYNPVRRLVQSLGAKSSSRRQGTYNEFHVIQEAIVGAYEEMDRLRSGMKQQRDIVRSHFIARLLKGRLDGRTPVDESLAAFGMRFDSDEFGVMALYIEDVESLAEWIPGDDRNEKLKLIHFIVTNVTEEVAGRLHRAYVTEIDETLVCLICLHPEGGDRRNEELYAIANDIRQFLSSQYRIRLSVSIGGVHRTVAGIPQAYAEALDAMEYKLVMGRDEILSYGDLRARMTEGRESGYDYPLEVERQLINYVRTGDFPKARRTLDDIIERNFASPVMPLPLARCLLFDLVGTLVKAAGEAGALPEEEAPHDAKRIERLASCETIPEMRRQMTELLRAFCEAAGAKRKRNIEESRQRAIRELAEQVSVFIDERFADPDLNVSTIGAHFGLKPAYVSKLYKDQTGEGLLERINRARLTEAKRLIREGRNSVSDVARRVGFHDVNAFIRVFKRYEGVTPGLYKESSTN